MQAWSRRPTGLIVPEVTYNVLSGTLTNQPTVCVAQQYNTRFLL